MSTEPRCITIARLMADTGLGPRQARHDVRLGLLPGRMRGTTYVCPPGEYDRWYRGEWSPRTADTADPTPMVHRVVFKDPTETT